MIGLVDGNNFYASCIKAFRPDLKNKPVVVLSNNDGCIIARSPEAKNLGIRMGEPIFKRTDFLKHNQVNIFSANFTLFGDMSDRMMNSLAKYVPTIEVYSIDEAFLDFSGFKNYDLPLYSTRMLNEVAKGTGLSLACGIAPTKALAKMANQFAKYYKKFNNLCIIDSKEKIEKALKTFPVEKVWGIGRQTAKLMKALNCKTAWDFTRLSDDLVRSRMKIVGLRLKKELLGKSCLELEQIKQPKKSILNSRSFGKLMEDIQDIAEAVTTFASFGAATLREQHCCCTVVTVFLATNTFRLDLPQYYQNRSITIPVASNSTLEITNYALQALQTIFESGYKYKKAGVLLSGIIPADEVQGSLLDCVDREKHSKLMTALDGINHKYGRTSLHLGNISGKNKWGMKQEKLSPCYTTRWSDIIKTGKLKT